MHEQLTLLSARLTMPVSRRDFLQQLSTTAGLGLVTLVPGRALWGMSAAMLLPTPLDEAQLRSLAAAAVEAARAAGADFADVRIGSGRTVRVRSEYLPGRNRGRPEMDPPMVRVEIGYGIRVLVNGAWGFASGFEMTPDGVRRVARAAVVRAGATTAPNPVTLTPASVVTDGRWSTPIERNAFDVALGEQGDLQLEALSAAAEVPGVQRAVVDFGWQETDRVYASSEGSVLVQRLYAAVPNSFVAATAAEAYSGSSETIRSFRSGGYGYEAVAEVDAARELKEAAERAVEVSSTLTPPLSVGVGRYDLVLSASAMNSVVAQTLARALDAERVLGFQANQSGTSYAAPPADVVGQMQIAAPLVTLRADRSRPHGHATVAWDDEGVAPRTVNLIENGVLMNYLTTRETAPECVGPGPLGAAAASNGCATGAGQHLPEVQLPNLTLDPAPGEVTEEELIADVARGFYVESLMGGPDHQLLSAQYSVGHGRAWEIRNGRKVGQIRDMAVQFITPQFWKSLDALAGAGTVEESTQNTPFALSRQPLQQWFSTTSTVPGRFREVNVLNTGRAE